MSSTRYSRDKLLRLDEQERQALNRAVMDQITARSTALNTAGGGTQDEINHVRTLRGLLDRLTDL